MRAKWRFIASTRATSTSLTCQTRTCDKSLVDKQVTAMVLTFAHTLGEFGIVLMVGGSIPGETKTVAIAIYDKVQAFDDRGAGIMSAVLVAMSLVTIALVYWLSARMGRRLS